MKKSKLRWAATSAALIALSLTACSSSGNASESTPGDASAASVKEAQDFLKIAMENPASIGYDTKLEKPVPKGINTAALVNPIAISEVTHGYRKSATDLLGWNLHRVTVGSGPEAPAKALEQALDGSPDVATYAGFDPSTLSAQLDRARNSQIPIIGESVTVKNPAVVANVRGIESNDHIAKMTAAFVVADSKGQANVEFFNVPSLPILTSYYDSFIKYMKEWCPGCKVNLNNFELPDIGTNLPGKVVSALQRNPKADYSLFGFGDSAVGVEAALQSAGLTEQVKIGGAIPSLANYEGLKNGTNAFWAADASPTMAWRQTDLMIRALNHEDLSTVDKAPLTAQLLTPDNIGSAVFDSKGYWIGYAGYAEDYKKLWGIK